MENPRLAERAGGPLRRQLHWSILKSAECSVQSFGDAVVFRTAHPLLLRAHVHRGDVYQGLLSESASLNDQEGVHWGFDQSRHLDDVELRTGLRQPAHNLVTLVCVQHDVLHLYCAHWLRPMRQAYQV